MFPVSRALVTVRVLKEIFLVVVLCVVPPSRWLDRGDDLLAFWVEVLLLNLSGNLFGYTLLFWSVVENGRAVFYEIKNTFNSR